MLQSSIRLPRFLVAGIMILSLAMAFILMPAANEAHASVSKGKQVAEMAKSYKGTPYKWGGNTAKAFDASGFTQFIFKKSAIKMNLPHNSKAQYKLGKAVVKKNLIEGDLVFFKTDGKDVSFVGIYLGKNQFIAATSRGVTVQTLTSKYWKDRFVGAKHLLP